MTTVKKCIVSMKNLFLYMHNFFAPVHLKKRNDFGNKVFCLVKVKSFEKYRHKCNLFLYRHLNLAERSNLKYYCDGRY